MYQQRDSASLIMKASAATICAAIAMYWPAYVVAPSIIGALLRPILLVSAAIMSMCLLQEPVTAIEVRTLKLFGAMWLLVLLTSAMADNPRHALIGFVKIVLIQLLALLMARALRYEPAARVFGTGMFVASIIITLFIVYAYLTKVGPVLPSYVGARIFKGMAEHDGYSLNDTPATAILAFLCAICLRPMTRTMWAVGAMVVFVGAFLTGSRAALVTPALAAILLLAVAWRHSNRLARRMIAVTIFLSIFAGVTVAIAVVPSHQFSKLSEGRWDLWRAGISKFLERPLFGSGFLSWQDDLTARLPGDYGINAGLHRDNSGQLLGGYHNQFIQVLSEHGLAGFIALSALYIFILRSAAALAFRKTLVWKFGYAALFGALFLLVRANVELDGLFGFAQDPVDYTAYLFLAIVVSRLSLEEMAARPLSVRWRSAARPPRRIPAVPRQSPLREA